MGVYFSFQLIFHCLIHLFSGTVERLSGIFRDTLAIRRSFIVDDGTGDTIIEVMDEARAPLVVDYRHPKQRHTAPAYGGPVRPGTGAVLSNGSHVHR